MSTGHEDGPFSKASAVLRGHESEVLDVTFIPGTRLLATCSQDKSLRVWDLDTGKQVEKPLLGHDTAARRLTASPDGRWIVSGGDNGSILVWEVATKSVLVSFKGHEDHVCGLVFAPDSEKFASASWDKTVCIWKRETGEIFLGPLQVGSEAYSVSYSPDGSKLAAGTEEHIIIWNTEGGEGLLRIEQRAFRVAFTPDGLRLVSGDWKDIRISNTTTGDIIKQFDAHTQYFLSLSIAPNGTKFATTSHDKTTRFFDLTTFEPIGEPLEHPGVVWGVAFSEDSQLIATSCRDKLVRTWTVPLCESEKEELKQQETNPDLPSPDDELPSGFFGDRDVHTSYPPRRSNHLPYGLPQRSAPQSRIMTLVNHLSFRGQTHPSAGHPHHSNRVTQFLQQRLPFRRSMSSPGQPQVINVAAVRADNRIIINRVPHLQYKKVHDTRRPPREEPVSHDTAQSDTSSEISYTDSLPNVHWFTAFLCYLSCWSGGKLRMPPRWVLEPVQPPHQSNGGDVHARS